jgi:ribosome biogenesis GTPase
MIIEKAGLNEEQIEYCAENNIDMINVGRVIAEHKGRYIVKTNDGEFSSEVTGKLMYEADGRSSYPAVGDWVEIVADSDSATIKRILPRKSVIERRAIGGKADIQIIATNVDYGLIVQAVGRDFNINRLERYITICQNSKIEPIIVLSKADLIKPEQLEELVNSVKERIKNVQIITISNETTGGIKQIESAIIAGKTYCLLGSSGVGKSTLINNLCGKTRMETGEIGSKTNKGKHVTTHRELIVLDGGGIIIDNPGMREVGISEATEGLQRTFNNISDYAQHCKFKNCSHTKEKGCAVLQAFEQGSISQESYHNYHRMQREAAHYESTLFERRRKDKAFGKMVKNAKKYKNR